MKYKNRKELVVEYCSLHKVLYERHSHLLDKFLPQTVHINPSKYKEEILDFIKLHGKRPTKHSSDKKESILGMRLTNYTNIRSGCFDVQFKNVISSISSPNRRSYSLQECKSSALPFSKREEWAKSCPKEHRYAVRYGWIDKCCLHMSKTRDSETKKNCILEFIKTKNRLPSPSSSDKKEKYLATQMNVYRSPSANSFDPAFKNKLEKLKNKLEIA